MPRARLTTPEGGTAEWKSQALRAYQRRTLAADALIASSYLAGTNTRRVRRALAALFGGTVGKDTVSRTWRKVKGDWDAWNSRSLAAEPIVRLILDGTVVRVRLDRKATSISLLVVLGVRADGQKVLLAIKSMGGESAEAWRTVLDDLIKRGLRRPEFLIVDGAPGLDKAIAVVWDGVPVQRCTVHKHRNLLAHAPERLHDEITANYNDMIYAATPEEITVRRKAFIRKWRLKHRAVADSLEEAGDRLFTFARLPPSQWRSLRTTNAIERLHEEFKRRIKTQTVLPSADTAATANLIDGSRFDNPRPRTLARTKAGNPAGGDPLFPLDGVAEKFAQRLAGSIGGGLVEFHMTPAIPGRRLQDRKVEREIGVGIDDQPDRGALALLAGNSHIVLAGNQLAAGIRRRQIVVLADQDQGGNRHVSLEAAAKRKKCRRRPELVFGRPFDLPMFDRRESSAWRPTQSRRRRRVVHRRIFLKQGNSGPDMHRG